MIFLVIMSCNSVIIFRVSIFRLQFMVEFILR